MTDKDDFNSRIDLCLINYDIACDDIANLFCEKHDFQKIDSTKYGDTFWVGDKRGTVLFCNDYYFDMETIVTDLKEHATDEQLLEWYDNSIENGTQMPMNYQTWLKTYNNKK